jgi:crotonobetainyl-CoA:carnitine CoA-transferase CaiB-like acyl-CoA transferase
MPGVRGVRARTFDDLRPLALAADIVLIDSPGWSDVPFGDDARATLEDRSDVIVVSVTPFGQSGPCAGYAATNLTAFAMGGIVSLTGHPSREPLVTGGSQAYALGGLNAFSAALAAYYGRLVHGESDWIDISMQECSAAMLELYGPGSESAKTGPSPRRGNHIRAVGGIYPCAEGWAGVCCLERQIPGFFRLLDDPALSEERFADPMQRAENDDELTAIVYNWFGDKTKAEILRLGPEHKVPLGAVMTPGDLLASESLDERDFFDAVQSMAGTARIPGRPFPGFGWHPGQLHVQDDTAAVMADWVGVRA